MNYMYMERFDSHGIGKETVDIGMQAFMTLAPNADDDELALLLSSANSLYLHTTGRAEKGESLKPPKYMDP